MNLDYFFFLTFYSPPIINRTSQEYLLLLYSQNQDHGTAVRNRSFGEVNRTFCQHAASGFERKQAMAALQEVCENRRCLLKSFPFESIFLLNERQEALAYAQ